MRTTFINTLLELADTDDRIWLLCGDLGYSVLEPFFERFPARFINVGVAEQNMIGIAAGLAQSGHVAFCYSIANFPTLRCLEQIRNDVCYHDCNVNIVSVGGGVAYGAQGYSHHALEDLAVMRALPNMVVAAPGDPLEVRSLTRALVNHPGPGFLRLGKAGEAVLHDAVPSLEIGQVLPLREGNDVILLSTGGMLETALQVAARLHQRGVSTGVTSVPFLKPLDTAYVTTVAQRTALLCTVEEHGSIGGLGEAVASCLAQLSGIRARLLPFSMPESSTKGVSGDQHYLRTRGGLDPDSIFAAVTDALEVLPKRYSAMTSHWRRQEQSS
ncbi:MAG: transketolase [Gemmatimonadota bacterium]|nr:transketolase [Gemmatimonadota bacterium]